MIYLQPELRAAVKASKPGLAERNTDRPEVAAMTGYLEHQAASVPKQSLAHYAEAQRRARRTAGEGRARRLTRGLVKSSRTA
jgi:hypothetical protein